MVTLVSLIQILIVQCNWVRFHGLQNWCSTSIFGLDWGVEYTTTGGYAAPGVDEDTTAGGDHVVGYVSCKLLNLIKTS